MKRILYILLGILAGHSLFAQKLQPGFDKSEYTELLYAYSRWSDSTHYKGIPESSRFKRTYRSEEMGLVNRWELYEDPYGINVISIRGTTPSEVSWLANFYAAMIPAKGKLQLNDSTTFEYHFADEPRAAVHVGWSVASAFLLQDIIPVVWEQYNKGIRDFIIFGHSQGGGISYLITAQLLYYQKTGILPADMYFKTYCSAAPKPGNLPFAYEYEASRQTGWSQTVVNAADWVPEVPVSIQTLTDFNVTNPFKNAKSMISKQKFPTNLALKHIYNQLTKHNKKAMRRYQKYLGKAASKFVVKQLVGYKAPNYFESNYYVRTGTTTVLYPDSLYYTQYPDSDTNVFVHHSIQSYLYLTDKLVD
ncbi:lipase family protein [Flavobacterium sp. WV_118_3]|uniref:lipase family protein n=1 Tax=Flavobacterium sp. WV_118_3 TaxID=3151764 RepID=UPI00321B9BB4